MRYQASQVSDKSIEEEVFSQKRRKHIIYSQIFLVRLPALLEELQHSLPNLLRSHNCIAALLLSDLKSTLFESLRFYRMRIPPVFLKAIIDYQPYRASTALAYKYVFDEEAQ